MDDLGSVINDFLVESHENLDQLDRDLVSLEQTPESPELLQRIFRTIHTIKGTCGFLGFGKLEQVTHVGENLLSRLRDGQLSAGSEITTSLLALVDAVREMLRCIECDGQEGEIDYSALIERLIELQELPSCTTATPGSDDTNALVALIDAAEELLAADTKAGQEEPSAGTQVDRDASGKAANQELNRPREERASGASESTIRVDVGLLDRLMNQVGELVLARNQILQLTGTVGDAVLQNATQRLNLIASELQEGVMKTRMQPIGNIWSKFPRVVRDVAMQCGKEVRIEMEGRETELDKTIIEAIKDPLTHIVRNAIDHGVESPTDRAAKGKSAEGRLLLRAFHEGGHVNIEIRDDGAGLNLDRIRRKAVERNLLSLDQAERLTDRDVALLIFSPGFSTAAQVTNVSGRGVGMDVVRTNVERIGGTVDVHSLPDEGTTVKLKIPLTLAIIPALTVTCAGERYAIPQVSLLELVRLDAEQAARGIERFQGAPVYRLRGQLLPIVYLRRELGLADIPKEEAASEGPQVVNIVVLRADDRQFGLVVDAINDTEEIVVKPLGKQLKGVPVFAGATIMGDGQVALILDVLATASRAGVVATSGERARPEASAAGNDATVDRHNLLLLDVQDRRLALPVSMVSRLEEVPCDRVEQSQQGQVTQYRGQIMPLVHLAELVGIPRYDAEASDPLQVVVYRHHERSIGLVVDRVVDIIETTIDVEHREDRPATTAVVQRRVTELVDLPAVLGTWEQRLAI